MNARRVMLFLVLPLLFLALPLSACDRKKETVSTVLLRVDNRTVTQEEFLREFQKTLPPEQNLTAEERGELQRAFLVQIIDRELTLAEAGRLGINVEQAEVEAALQEHRKEYPVDAFEEMLKSRGLTLQQWRKELEEALLMEKVVREAVYADIAVSDEESATYYHEHRDEFDRPAQVRARQIVLANEADGQRVLGLLEQGGDFDAVARANSLSPDADQGGDLGFFSRGEMPPEFEAVVFSLPVGRNSDLIKTEYGYHIFRVEERREPVRLALPAVREEISEKLRSEKEEAAYQEWLQEQRNRAAIEVNWSLI